MKCEGTNVCVEYKGGKFGRIPRDRAEHEKTAGRVKRFVCRTLFAAQQMGISEADVINAMNTKGGEAALKQHIRELRNQAVERKEREAPRRKPAAKPKAEV